MNEEGEGDVVQLVTLSFQTEEFYRWKKTAETESFFGYREAVMKGFVLLFPSVVRIGTNNFFARALSILPTLNESSEPTLIWAEGLRLFAGNTGWQFASPRYKKLIRSANSCIEVL